MSQNTKRILYLSKSFSITVITNQDIVDPLLFKNITLGLTLFAICRTAILAAEWTSVEFSEDGRIWKYTKSNTNFTLTRDKNSSCLYYTTHPLLFTASVLYLYEAMTFLLSLGVVTLFCPAAYSARSFHLMS